MKKHKPCKRCKEPFIPEWIPSLKKWSNCCELCKLRNVFDGLGLPTPPTLLDKYTKKPTLTKEEWKKKLKRGPRYA